MYNARMLRPNSQPIGAIEVFCVAAIKSKQIKAHAEIPVAIPYRLDAIREMRSIPQKYRS